MNSIYENCNSAIEACNIAEKNNDNRIPSEILKDKIKNIDCTKITVNKNTIKEVLLYEKECGEFY